MHRIDTTTAHTSVREAFANCIIHCAYTVMGNITVDRYFNRIVFELLTIVKHMFGRSETYVSLPTDISPGVERSSQN